MNVLLLDLFGSFQIKDLEICLKKRGDKCKVIQRKVTDKYHDELFSAELVHELEDNTYDMVFSTNYYPIVAEVCNKKQVIYSSWTYDSPPEIPSTETMDYLTNRIYFFGKSDYLKYADQGFENVYYLPLAVNTDRLSTMHSERKYECDVSLVGGVYTSESFLGLKSLMTKEQQDYLTAVVNVQLQHSGSVVVDAALTDEFVKSVCDHFREQSPTAIQPTKEMLFYSICSHITHIDRLSLLRLCGDGGFKTRLFATNKAKTDLLSGHNIIMMNSVDYETEMPKVFKSSKINLNPTLRANRTGIPLRVVDVLGSRSFLLTNHQSEMDDFFLKDEIATYENCEEAMDKIRYYLKNDSEREGMIQRGFERVKKDFSYEERIQTIINNM